MITLKNIKHSQFASQETHCYEATVYFDGKKAGIVGNDGHGGCDHENPTNRKVWDAMQKYISTLPDHVSTGGGNHSIVMLDCLEFICSDLVNKWLATKDLKRMLKNRVVMKRADGVIVNTNTQKNPATLEKWIAQMADENPEAIILNKLTFEEALVHFASA